MARKQVVEITCDRCQRVENQEVLTAAPTDKELSVSFHGQFFEYQDLCRRCRDACGNYFRSITKQPEEEKAQAAPIPPEKSGFLGLGGGKKS